MSVFSIYAQCQYGLQKPQEAVNIVNNYMVQAETMGHTRLLLVYSRIAIECGGAYQEGLSAVLKCMVAVNPTGVKLTDIAQIGSAQLKESIYSGNLNYETVKVDMHTILLTLLMLDCKEDTTTTTSATTTASKVNMPLFSKVLPTDIEIAPKTAKAPYAIAAYAYIADICKENGAIPLAMKIYKDKILHYFNNYTELITNTRCSMDSKGSVGSVGSISKQTNPNSNPNRVVIPYVMNYILTYIHLVELTGDLRYALEECLSLLTVFLANHRVVLTQYQAHQSNQSNQYQQEIVMYGRIVYMVECYISTVSSAIGSSNSSGVGSGTGSGVGNGSNMNINWVVPDTTSNSNSTSMNSTSPHSTDGCSLSHGTTAHANTTNSEDGYHGYFHIHSDPTPTTPTNVYFDSNERSNQLSSQSQSGLVYTGDVHDTLAMGFTIIKILFLVGNADTVTKGQFNNSSGNTNTSSTTTSKDKSKKSTSVTPPSTPPVFKYRAALLELYHVIEPVRLNATVALHKTLVRNGMYMCVYVYVCVYVYLVVSMCVYTYTNYIY